nr:hypothetical protein [Fusobacterium gastrosuis]
MEIFIKKRELLKNEVIKEIRDLFLKKKKAIEEKNFEKIFSTKKIQVKYREMRFIFDFKIFALLPDYLTINLKKIKLSELESELIQLKDELKKITEKEVDLISYDEFQKAFYKEKNTYVQDGKITNYEDIDRYIVKKDDKYIVIDSNLNEVPNNDEGLLIPVIKFFKKSESIQNIIEFFEEEKIEMSLEEENKLKKLKDLKQIYSDIKKYKFSENKMEYNEQKVLEAFEDNQENFKIPSTKIKEYIEKLKNLEKIRLGLDPYDDSMFKDYKKGNWDIYYEDTKKNVLEREMIKIYTEEEYFSRNPKIDIKNGGIVGIDFGTKSTVVAFQEQNEKTMLARISGISLKKNLSKEQYENPTVMEILDIENFKKKYDESKGRPFTEWNDLRVSHAALSNFKQGSKFILNDLKQWAGSKNEKIIIYDKKNTEINLKSFIDLEDNDFDPIEYYAYYIGSHINNMNTENVFLKYILSFPVTFSNEVKEKILKSFEKGIKKSLPVSILEDEEIMKEFEVYKGTNEPTAYFLCAAKEFNKLPTKKDEPLFYGIFDFGGGTTDFSFGICRYIGKERYDYEVEYFGEGGDKYLGGENILKKLAYEICRKNLKLLRENGIPFYCPIGCTKFEGYETLINTSYEAIYNIEQIAEKMRDYWEDNMDQEEYRINKIKLNLLKSSSENDIYELEIDLDESEKIIKQILENGVDNFINSLYNLFKNGVSENIDSMEIFLAGNASKSKRLHEIFNNKIKDLEKKINNFLRIENKEIFKINGPLLSRNNKEIEINGKTGTAIGLLNARKGSRYKLIALDELKNNSEINFQYYVGYLKDKNLEVILDYKSGYNNWIKFMDASEIETEIYYTTIANSLLSKIDGANNFLKRDRIKINKEYQNNEYIFVRIKKTNIIEYVVSTEEKIKNEEYIEQPKEIFLI